MLNGIFIFACYFYLAKCVRLNLFDNHVDNSSAVGKPLIDPENFHGIAVRDGVYNSTLLVRRGETAEIEALGSGATVVVVAAAGVWSTVTIGSCGSCVWTAGANIPGCVICGGGLIGSLITGAIACVKGNGCGGSGSVRVNGRMDSGIDLHDYHEDDSFKTYKFSIDEHEGFTLYANISASKMHIVSSPAHHFEGMSTEQVFAEVTSDKHKINHKRDNYDIEWLSYEFDNWNRDLTYAFDNAYESSEGYIKEHAAAALAAGGTTKYCMSLAIGADDNSFQNAIHGEMYTNNYGGVDSFCNQNDDDSHANVDCNAHWDADGNSFMEWGC